MEGDYVTQGVGTVLINKPHLVASHKRILVSLLYLYAAPAIMYMLKYYTVYGCIDSKHNLFRL